MQPFKRICKYIFFKMDFQTLSHSCNNPSLKIKYDSLSFSPSNLILILNSAGWIVMARFPNCCRIFELASGDSPLTPFFSVAPPHKFSGYNFKLLLSDKISFYCYNLLFKSKRVVIIYDSKNKENDIQIIRRRI